MKKKKIRRITKISDSVLTKVCSDIISMNLKDAKLVLAYFPQWIYPSILMDNGLLGYDYSSISKTLHNLYQFEAQYEQKDGDYLILKFPMKDLYSSCFASLIGYTVTGLKDIRTGMKTRHGMIDSVANEFIPNSEKDQEFIFRDYCFNKVIVKTLLDSFDISNSNEDTDKFLIAKFKITKVI